jgi:5-methylcytosine-specific restriction endonuclease McrA
MGRYKSKNDLRAMRVASAGVDRERAAKRKSASARGYDSEWQRLRALVIREVLNSPGAVCPLCGREFDPHNSKAIHLDHIERIADNPGRRLDPNNWRAVHHACHSQITAQEDRAKERGFGLGAGDDGMPADPNHPFNRERDN